MGDAQPVLVEVWTDVSCPWCYIAHHRLEAALEQRPDAERVAIRLRSYELHPEWAVDAVPLATVFERVHGGGPEAFVAVEGQMRELARAEGLAFEIDRPVANTTTVHRLLQYATGEGLGVPFFSAVQDGYFGGTVNPFDKDELVAAAVGAGLDAVRSREVVEGDDFAGAVRADIAEGRALGVTGVPFTVYDRRFATSGALPVEGYAKMLAEVLT